MKKEKRNYVAPCIQVYALEACQPLACSTEKLEEDKFDWDE